LVSPVFYDPRQSRTAASTLSSVAPEILPAGGSEKRLGSSERSWKQRKTVSMDNPLSAGLDFPEHPLTQVEFRVLRAIFGCEGSLTLPVGEPSIPRIVR
jgi:hypothetical protein